jgi:hypothetical protein
MNQSNFLVGRSSLFTQEFLHISWKQNVLAVRQLSCPKPDESSHALPS